MRSAADSDCFFFCVHMLQMFKGNDGADAVKYNVFEVPIIAQWVRINPTRWRDRISMRAELYGCEYGEFPVYFQFSFVHMIFFSVL